MNYKNGGPAFPHHVEWTMQGPVGESSGMTLRDYFAAKAMQGTISDVGSHPVELIVSIAYKLADAMLAERDK